MHQDQAARILALFICSTALWSCGRGSGSDPSDQVEDPRAHAIESLQTMDLNAWWQAYRDPDPVKIGAIVDAVAKREPAGLPKDRSRLDIFIRHRIAGRYRSSMSDADEGKAYILAQAEARYANPPTKVWDAKGRCALLDYHILPGTWRSVSRVSEGLQDPPAIGSNPYLKPEVLARSLQRLVTKHPEAKIFQIRYQYHFGSGLKKVLMEFVPDRQIVYRERSDLVFTKNSVPWKDLLAGHIDLATLDWDSPMEGYDAPPINWPPSEVLPADD